MAEKNKMTTVEQLKMLALRAQADSAARIADLAALIAAGYGQLITVTLPVAKWGGRAQKVEHKSPDVDLTVNILRLEVDTE